MRIRYIEAQPNRVFINCGDSVSASMLVALLEEVGIRAQHGFHMHWRIDIDLSPQTNTKVVFDKAIHIG